MSEVVLHGDPPVKVTLRRSRRARRMTLRVSRLDGRVTLTLPNSVAEADAARFAGERAAWIREHLAGAAQMVQIGIGAELPVLGEAHRIAQGPGRAISMAGGVLHVPGPEAQAGRRLQAWLRELARSELTFAADQYARALGRDYARITLRDTRSRWGSCSAEGALMFSWRLILAPAEVLAYVAAHEVAHLEEMNHSARFWNVVERIHGPYDTPRRWLRDKGHRLHGYRFDGMA